jgi:hypothetical protein
LIFVRLLLLWYTGNHVIEGDGDAASHSCYQVQVRTTTVSFTQTGVYDDTVVTVNDD